MSGPAHKLRGDVSPRLLARHVAAERSLASAPDPVDVFASLAGEGRRPGALLLESADPGAPEGRRSIALPYPLLRLTLRGRALAVRPLDERGLPLLEPLAAALEGLGDLQTRGESIDLVLPERERGAARLDRERLLEPSPLDAVRALARLICDEATGAPLPILVCGAFAFDLVDHFEDLPPRPPSATDDHDLNLVLATDGIVYDHARGRVSAVVRSLGVLGADDAGEDALAAERLQRFTAALDAPRLPVPTRRQASPVLPAFVPDLDDDVFLDAVRSLKASVRKGDVFQAVLSRALRVASAAPPLRVYRHLRALGPSPYLFHFELGDGALLGASPETCVRVQAGEVSLVPIAGTAPRGRDAHGHPDDELDQRLGIGLLLDRKEQAEHAMLIDLARNDLARVCRPGARAVRSPLALERYSHVQHLVTRVQGPLDAGLDALDAYRACANMGTLTGAPKLRATELLRGLEGTARGYYGGALGYVTAAGELDTCIVIRALRQVPGGYVVRAGAGIVHESDPRRELEETLHKARAPLLAIGLSAGGGS